MSINFADVHDGLSNTCKSARSDRRRSTGPQTITSSTSALTGAPTRIPRRMRWSIRRPTSGRSARFRTLAGLSTASRSTRKTCPTPSASAASTLASSTSPSAPDGHFRARDYGRAGLAPGKYKVLISKKAEPPPGTEFPYAIKVDRVQQEMMGIRKETLPPQYTDPFPMRLHGPAFQATREKRHERTRARNKQIEQL